MKKLILDQEKQLFIRSLVILNYPESKEVEVLKDLGELVTDLIEEFYTKLIGNEMLDHLKNANGLCIKKGGYLSRIDCLDINLGGLYYPNLILNKGVMNRKIPISTKVTGVINIGKNLPDSFYIEDIYNKKIGEEKYHHDILKDLNKYVDKYKWLELICLVEDYLELLSLKVNYEDQVRLSLWKISTEEELKKSDPELYKQYMEFSKTLIDEDNKEKHIIRTGREVKDILEEYQSLLT